MATSDALKIPKRYLPSLSFWLQKQSLAGKESRIRTRFVKAINESIRITDAEKQEIIEKYVEKEKDKKTGKLVRKTVLDNGVRKYAIKKGKEDVLNTELEDLYAEDYIMSVTPETKENIKVIKDILLNTEYKFGMKEGMSVAEQQDAVFEAQAYDVWCEAFEAVTV